MKLNILSRIGFVIAGLTALSLSASAQVSFNGAISMDSSGLPGPSGIVVNTHDLSSATVINNWIGSVVVSVSGNIPAGLSGQPVNFANPWVIGTPQSQLWEVNGFSFDLVSATVTQGSFYLNVFADGILNGPSGFTSTPATWNFGTSGLGTPLPGSGDKLFSWSSSTTSVPDGGTTVALLGCSLLGLHGLRRKLAKP